MAAGYGDGPEQGREQLDEQRGEHLRGGLDAVSGQAGERGQRGGAGVERGFGAAGVVLLSLGAEALAQFGGAAGGGQFGGQRLHAGVCAGGGGAGGAALARGGRLAASECGRGAGAAGCGCCECVGHGCQRASPQSIELSFHRLAAFAAADAGGALVAGPVR